MEEPRHLKKNFLSKTERERELLLAHKEGELYNHNVEVERVKRVLKNYFNSYCFKYIFIYQLVEFVDFLWPDYQGK